MQHHHASGTPSSGTHTVFSHGAATPTPITAADAAGYAALFAKYVPRLLAVKHEGMEDSSSSGRGAPVASFASGGGGGGGGGGGSVPHRSSKLQGGGGVGGRGSAATTHPFPSSTIGGIARQSTFESLQVSDVAAVSSLCRLLGALHMPANGYGDASAAPPSDADALYSATISGNGGGGGGVGGAPVPIGYERSLESLFAFAAVWSLGATLNEAGRKRFNEVRGV